MTTESPSPWQVDPRDILGVFRRVAEQISGGLDLDETLRRVVVHVAEQFGAEECHLFLIDGERVSHVASHGTDGPLPPYSFVELDAGLTGWVLRHRASAHTADTVADERNTGLARERALEVGPRSAIVVPVTSGDEAIGTLTLLAAAGRLSPASEELALLEIVAAHCGAAIAHARLHDAERAAHAQLEAQVDEIERMNQERERTTATIAHELRNAIHGAVGALSLIEDPAEMDRPMISLASTAVTDASEIIARLLEPDREEAPSPGESVIDLCELGDRVSIVTGLEHRCASDGLLAVGDPMQVRQIVRNLVDNAQRHGGPTRWVETGRCGDMAEIRVVDNGDGVDPAVVGRLFEAYATTGETIDGRVSLGLGLNVSRQMARSMDGDLRYVHTDDVTRFTLSLPAFAST